MYYKKKKLKFIDVLIKGEEKYTFNILIIFGRFFGF